MKTALHHGRLTRRRVIQSGRKGAHPACHAPCRAASPPPQERGLLRALACGALAKKAALRRMPPRHVAWESPRSPAPPRFIPP